LAESPAATLARVLGGVVLLQGGLGHQVLGQLLIAGTSELAIAGAYVVVSATNRQQNALGQAAIRTAVPAIAVHSLIKRDLERLEAKEQRLIKETRDARSRFTLLASHHQDVIVERNQLRDHLTVLRSALAMATTSARPTTAPDEDAPGSTVPIPPVEPTLRLAARAKPRAKKPGARARRKPIRKRRAKRSKS
jgi:hypothetical protein